MDDSSLTDFVTTFLKKKGFNEPETAFRAELQRRNNNSSGNNSVDVLNDRELSKFFRSFSESEDGPAGYQDEYSKLRSWTYSSLDLYKHELLRVLYPVFIHCFMDLVAKKHIQEARTFLNSFHEDHEMLHLRDLQKLIYTRYIALKCLESSMNGLTSKLLEDSLENCLEKTGGLLSDSEKAEGENKEGEVDENKKRSVEGGKQGTSMKKSKKDKAINATAKTSRPGANTVSVAP